VELVDAAAITDALATLHWERDGNELVKVVRKYDFRGALSYVNDVGRLAEEAGHHPDIELRWNTVTLRLRTHSLGGITDADLSLARRIDGLG
jgi:4a-hydroxytetrahydrobiopterin dehydratase